MAATLAAAAALAADTEFRGRVQVALVYTARLVREGQADSTDDDKQKRKLAKEILLNPSEFTEPAAWALASIPEVTGGPTGTADGDLISLVGALLLNLIGS